MPFLDPSGEQLCKHDGSTQEDLHGKIAHGKARMGHFSPWAWDFWRGCWAFARSGGTSAVPTSLEADQSKDAKCCNTSASVLPLWNCRREPFESTAAAACRLKACLEFVRPAEAGGEL